MNHFETTTEPVPRSEEVRLYVGAPDRFDPRPASWLARLFRLDVWGGSLLGQRARAEMSAMAWLLLLVFCFELTAWSLLFNVMIHAAQWTVSWITLVAIALGAMFSGAVFLFERGFLTSDSSVNRRKRALAYTIRFIVIVASAFATAQPIELLLFGNEINGRLRTEAVQREALRLSNKGATIDSAQALAAARTAKTEAAAKLEKRQGELKQLNQQVAMAEAKIQQLDKEIGAAKNKVKNKQAKKRKIQQKIRDAPLPEEKKSLKKQLYQLRGKLRAHRNALDAKLQARQQVVDEQTNLTASMPVAQQKIEDARTRVTEEHNRFHNITWKDSTKQTDSDKENRDLIALIGTSPLGKPIPGGPRPLNPYDVGFVYRLIVLWDLMSGRAAAWPPSSAAARKKAVETFLGENWANADHETVKRAAARASTFFKIFLVAFLVAIIVPLLTLAFKLLQGRELHNYYSTRAQAESGNPDALEVLRVSQASS